MQNRSASEKSAVLQMAFLGVVSLTVGIVCLLDACLIYGLPFLMSISESATTGVRTGMLLPFALGCMFTYCISYVGYCKRERLLVRVMGFAFLLVAMQIVRSPYVDATRVGLLGLSIRASTTLHYIGAIVGFGAMWVWIEYFFTKTRPGNAMTAQKQARNRAYHGLGTVIAFSLVLLGIGAFGVFPDGFPYVWLAEECILIPAGIALLIKSGLFLKDR